MIRITVGGQTSDHAQRDMRVQPNPGGDSLVFSVADKTGLLSRLNLFDAMGLDEVESISSELRMRHCRAHETVFTGSPDQVYLVKTGRVRLYRLSPEGQEVTTAVLQPGHLFGMGALFGSRNDDVSAEALEDTYVCEAGGQAFIGILSRHPLLMAKVMMAVAKQMFRLERTIEGLVHESVESRVARVLLEMSSSAEHTDDGWLLPARTRDEIGKVAMTTRESVSRVLSAWTSAGIVELQGRRIVVRDLERLRSLVRIEPGD